jgi:transcriptional regulator with PAS, ATPase and Fis domain
MYSYEKARSMSNLVLTATPNIIMIIDPQLHIREFNSRAEEVFKTSKNAALTMYVFDFIDSTDYEECLKNHTSITRKKKHWKDYGMTVLETIVYIEETSYLLAIIEDVTEEEKSKEKLMEKKLGTVKMAQSVIDKQMTTAQEIAGLLGETTAETKAILLKLRDYMLSDEEEV